MKTKIEKIAGLAWELNQLIDSDSLYYEFEVSHGLYLRKVYRKKGVFSNLEFFNGCSFTENSHTSWGFLGGQEYFIDQCISYLQILLEENKK